MESSIIKAITDAGMGLGSLIILAIVLLSQLQILRKMNEKLDDNTEATREMISTIKDFRETDQKVIESIGYCRAKNNIPL